MPGRPEATVGPSLGGMYTVAKGPTALLQKTRRGELDLPKGWERKIQRVSLLPSIGVEFSWRCCQLAQRSF